MVLAQTRSPILGKLFLPANTYRHPLDLTHALDVTLFPHLTLVMTLARHLAITDQGICLDVYELTPFNTEVDR